MEINEKLLSKKLRQRVKDLESNQIYGTEEGESISVYDSAEGYCKLHKTDENGNPYFPIGNMKQNTTTGKNLAKVTARETTTTLGITFTPVFEKNKELKYVIVNGTATSSVFWDISTNISVPSTGLILTGCPAGGNTNNSTYLLRAVYTDEDFSVDYGDGVVLKANKTVKRITIRINNGYTANNLKFYPMLSESGGEYEPYTDGASPNPEYPQQIECVTGTVNNKIQNENLIPFLNNINFSIGALKFYCQNGALFLNGQNYTEISVSNSIFKEKIAFDLEAGTYYFRYWKPAEIINNVSVVIKNYNTEENIIIVNNTFTLNENTKVYITFYFQASLVRYSNLKYPIMLIKGNKVPNNFIPHQEQTKTLHLGDKKLFGKDEVRDYFWKDLGNGNWYLKHHFKEKIFNGNENWRKQLDVNVFYITLEEELLANRKCICDSFITKANVNPQNVNYTCCGFNPEKQYSNFFYIKWLENEMTYTEFKNWLSEHNIKIVYRLATPTDELITDEVLIAELEDMLNNSRTYKNVTHIDNDSIAILNLEYVKDFNTIINNLTALVSSAE